jgi:hypothetical protein
MQINTGDIAKFWLRMYHEYNLIDHDDVLLGLNGVPYIGMLEPGDSLYKIDINDIEQFSISKRIDITDE